MGCQQSQDASAAEHASSVAETAADSPAKPKAAVAEEMAKKIKAISLSSSDSSPPPAPKMRLLKAAALVQMEHVPPYESLAEDAFVDITVEEFLKADFSARTCVISWRWAAPKPATLQAALSDEGKRVVPQALLGNIRATPEADRSEFYWLDWACVPQYKDAARDQHQVGG